MGILPSSSALPTDRQVARWVEPLARIGYAAKGVVFIMIGALAVRAALAESTDTRDAAGALAWLHERTSTAWMLTAVAIGLAAFVVWRLVQAAFDPEYTGGGGKRIAVRLFRLVSAAVYGSLAWTAWELARRGRSESQDESHWAAVLMSQPLGQWLAFAVGAGIAGYGLYQVWRGWSGDVERHMAFGSDAVRRRIVAIARVGLIARGVVLALVGWFLIDAARRFNPNAAGGTDDALRALGYDALMATVAAGLVAYGIYQLAEARYRRIG